MPKSRFYRGGGTCRALPFRVTPAAAAARAVGTVTAPRTPPPRASMADRDRVLSRGVVREGTIARAVCRPRTGARRVVRPGQGASSAEELVREFAIEGEARKTGTRGRESGARGVTRPRGLILSMARLCSAQIQTERRACVRARDGRWWRDLIRGPNVLGSRQCALRNPLCSYAYGRAWASTGRRRRAWLEGSVDRSGRRTKIEGSRKKDAEGEGGGLLRTYMSSSNRLLRGRSIAGSRHCDSRA